MRRLKASSVVGRDRLTWRTEKGRMLLFRSRGSKLLATVEPDSSHAGLYRIRYPDWGLSGASNLARAKDAALAFALRRLNSRAQQTAPKAPYVHRKGEEVVEPQLTANRLQKAANGSLAGGRS